jgi:hypothetical protein
MTRCAGSLAVELSGRLTKFCAVALLCFCMSGGLFLSSLRLAFAPEVRPRTQSPAAEPQTPADSQLPAAAPSPAKPEKDSEQTAAKKDDKEMKHHRGALVVAPLPIVSPAIGSGIIPVAGYIFPFQEKDKVSPPSVVGAAGLITNNGSRGFALGADLYMKENRYELKAAYFMAMWTTIYTVSVTKMEMPV